jgi:hypothetical protein
MNDTLPTHARTLPLYQAGIAIGRDSRYGSRWKPS